MDETDRIQRIEHRLLPRIHIAGEPLTAMSLADRMQHYTVPGVSMAYIRNGEIGWSRGYGVQAEGGKAVTPQMPFQAGSVSKPVTAMAALHLVEQGMLSLDEDVNAKLTSWQVPDNEHTRTEKVTLRRLLSHTAGVTQHAVGSYASDATLPSSLREILDGTPPAITDPITVDQTPGSGWRYSGGGYTIVQQLLIDVTGRPFPDLMHELILKPLGMDHSTFELPLEAKLRRSNAYGHDFEGKTIVGSWHVFPQMAAASLWSTAIDLAKFAIEVQAAWAGKSSRIISQSMAREMLTDQGGCGLGMFRSDTRFYHAGDTDGYKCEMMAFTETGEGVAIMTNGDRGVGLIEEIMRGLAQEYGWPEPHPTVKHVIAADASTYPSYAGRYQFDFSDAFSGVITVEDGRLMMEIVQPIGTNKAELLPEGTHRFFSRSSGVGVTFEPDDTGTATAMVLHQTSGTFRANRIS